MKKIQTYKGWGIYLDTTPILTKAGVSDAYYYAFLPGESPKTMDSPEWEDGSLSALKAFIDCY